MDDMETKNDKDAISVSATIPIKSGSNSIYESLKNKIQQLFNKEGKYRISLNYDNWSKSILGKRILRKYSRIKQANNKKLHKESRNRR